jgi:Asp-tRNA(Asn)/Glu-tRNA(Gln) amidotransferase A subunit family amidase
MASRPHGTSRREFFQAAATVLAFTTAAPARAQRGRGGPTSGRYDGFEKNIATLQADMAAGRTTAADLVQFYLDRIAAYDQNGPRLNAIIALNAHALTDARALDAERRQRRPRGPLHGIPSLLKDNFETSDVPTTGGCLALAGMQPAKDAFQVRKLRDAGAIILGKVNLHELALGLTTISSFGGQTLDAYDLSRAPGGSSGGSAVAAAANFAAATLGTDTSGSIRIPSSHNAVVGLRPTAGLSSRSGIIPFGHTQDTGGPIARTVTDIAILLDATVGYDPSDPTTVASKGRTPRTYTSSLKRGALKGARLGVLNEFFGSAREDEEVSAIVRGAVNEMTAQGATAIDIAIPNLSAQLAASNLLSQELKFYLGDYLKRSSAPVKSVEELLASGLHSAQLQGFLEGANAQPDDYLRSADYAARLAARAALATAATTVMDANRLDAIVYPTTRRIAPLIGGNQIGSNAGLSAQTGLPAITVPAGFTAGGFPVGVELLARAFAEPTLVALAYSYEQDTHHRRPPASTPPLGSAAALLVAIADSPAPAGGGDGRGVQLKATGAQSVPPSNVPFALDIRLSYSDASRRMSYELQGSGAVEQIAGVYLHRRASRPNGGVVARLATSVATPARGTITLSEPEAGDLKAGKCYISAISRTTPLLSARANIAIP